MTRRHILLGLALSAGLTTLTPNALGVAAAQSSAFSAEEVRRLGRGELIRRPLRSEAGSGRAFGGVSFIVIDASVAAVWEKARDPSALPALIPTLREAVVVERSEGAQLLRMHHRYPLGEASYHLRMRLNGDRHELDFHLDTSRPHDVDAGHGFLRLTPYRGKTLVTWGMSLEPGMGIVGQAFASMLDEWLLKPPLCLRDEVEPGRGGAC